MLGFGRSKRSGFSLIELLLVLGVLAILLVAAFVVYPQVRDRNQANTETSNVRAIQSNVRNMFATRGGVYTGIGTGPGNNNDYGAGNQARIFPATMNGGDYSAGAPITSTWGAPVFVWQRPAVNTPLGPIGVNRSFGIAYFDVPKGVCVPFVSAVFGGFESVAVGPNGAQLEVMTPAGLDVERLTAACALESPVVTFTSK
jgi:hypothetical protein